MPATLTPLPLWRTCVLRPRRVSVAFHPNTAANSVRRPAIRCFADDKSRAFVQAEPAQTGPNVEPQEHVSEEAAKIAKIQGLEGPDLSQGTPMQEILKDDKDARKQAPEVVKESIKAGDPVPTPSTSTGAKRSFSTYARRRIEQHIFANNGEASLDQSMIPSAEQRAAYNIPATTSTAIAPAIQKPGHKFPLPELPLPPQSHKDYRYDPLCAQIVGLLMRDGKKSVAQRHLDRVLDILRTSSPPTYSPTRSLLPGVPPASHLPLNPILYLAVAIDSVAPLLRLRSQRGAAGGGVALQIPAPLNQRQRRRTAIAWILEAASKRRSTGSGDGQLAQRIAQEIISVVEGKSALWDKRLGVHRLGTAARTNVNWQTRRR